MDYKKMIYRVGAILMALIFWQITAMVIHQSILMVTPIQVVKRLFTIWKEPGFASAVWFSFYHIAGGFLVGLLTGIVLAFLAYRFRILEELLWPWMATIKSVPVASFIVICLIWLSRRNLSIFISFLIVLPLVYQNILTGLKGQSREMLEMAELFRLPLVKRVRYIMLPAIRDYFLSACRVTCGMAWKAGIAAEVIGTPEGSIGKKLYLAKLTLSTDDLFAWTVIIVVVSVIFEKLFLYVIEKALNNSSNKSNGPGRRQHERDSD